MQALKGMAALKSRDCPTRTEKQVGLPTPTKKVSGRKLLFDFESSPKSTKTIFYHIIEA